MTETLLVDRWGSPQATLLEAIRLRMILDMRETARAGGWALRDTHFTADGGEIVATHQPCYRSEAGTGNAMGFVTWA
jgi:hypothetical protein